MGINNAGTNCIYAGAHTQNANNMCNGLDVSASGSGPSNQYVPENGVVGYVAEDGVSPYVTEA